MKSVKEMELIIQRLESQIASKNEQITELNAFIEKATAETQELIRSFRAFCIKVLESELAYGDISSRDLEAMSLTDLLARARNMLKQNQEKARSIYDTFKERLTEKNETIMIQMSQISQLKYELDHAEATFRETYNIPADMKRTPVYLLDTDTELEALKPAISSTTVLDENERVVSLDDADDKMIVDIVSKGSMYVQDVASITDQMKPVHWDVFQAIVESGLSEMSLIRMHICKNVKDEGEEISSEKASRLIKHLTSIMLVSLERINTGMRWFMVLKLTDIGKKIYIQQFKKMPVETEYQQLVHEHDNAEHGYTIKDVVQILKDTGKYRSISMSRKGNAIRLSDGRTSIPDVVACTQTGVEYYEVECGNHHPSDFNDKCNKLMMITKNIFFVSPNRETVEKKMRPLIEGWIKSRGQRVLQKTGIVVYLTSISDLAGQRWSYVYNMASEAPVYTATPAPRRKQEKEDVNA